MLATGSAPRTLPGLTIDGEHILTSEHAWRLDRLPASAVVLGGGVIGCEFASAWRSFGVEVTIVEALPRLLAAEEPASLRRPGTRVPQARDHRGDRRSLESATVESGGVRLSLAGDRTLTAELLLVAVGRGPVSDGLGYAEAGVALDRGFVSVDERLQTAVPGVYAVGDLVAGLQLAHRGFAHGIFVAEEIAHQLGRWEPAPVPVVDRDIPRVTYCDPEVASVGLTEEAARAELGDGRDGDLRPGRQRQVADPQDRTASSSWSARPAGRWSASTWSAPGSAS